MNGTQENPVLHGNPLTMPRHLWGEGQGFCQVGMAGLCPITPDALSEQFVGLKDFLPTFICSCLECDVIKGAVEAKYNIIVSSQAKNKCQKELEYLFHFITLELMNCMVSELTIYIYIF